ANAGIPPMLQSGMRSVVSALLLLAWAHVRGIPLFDRDGSLWAGVAAGAAFALEFLLLYQGLEWTTASRGVLFLYSMPFFVAIGAHLLIPGEKLTVTKAVGLVGAFCGLAIALGEGLTGGAGESGLAGDILCIIAGFAWAATTILIRTTALRF